MSVRPVHIAVVGHGRWAPVLLRNLHATPGSRPVLVCDHHLDRIDAARSRYPDLAGETEAAAVFERADIDAVVIATPIASHYDLALRALESGKHVLVEKPVATTLECAEHLCRRADELGLRLMVDHTLLFSEAVRAAESGRPITAIRARRINAGASEHDPLWDLAVHDVAVFEHLFDRDPVRVRAVGEGGILRGEVEYADGQGSFEVGWSDERARSWAVQGHRQPAEGRGAVEPVARVCSEFVASIREGRAPMSDGAFAVRVTRVLEALQRSRHTGDEVAL